MSDFLFIRSTDEAHAEVAYTELAALPPAIDAPVYKYSGAWGALLVREGQYAGFSPFESETHIIVVLGGPVLRFRDNSFLSSPTSSIACESILMRWLQGDLKPVDDLDGPFAILIVDKNNGALHCVTDLMLFVPVFAYCSDTDIVIGSHIDVTASAMARVRKGQMSVALSEYIDKPGMADFCLHGAISYPYTLYRDLYQLPPAYELRFSGDEVASESGFEIYGTPFWVPKQVMEFKQLEAASDFVRTGIESYVNTVVDAVNGNGLAQFISAGEDSRVIAGLLRQTTGAPIEAQVYTDSYNKELKIAERAARFYDLNFRPIIRDPNHYFDILPDATRLTGSQFQYHHSHPFKVQADSLLPAFTAVFGGFSADVMLKGQYTPKNKLVERLRFLPDVEATPAVTDIKVRSALFSTELLTEVERRRNNHLARVKRIRDSDHLEWYSIWPATMRKALPNVLANRRLFRSYEPFVSNTAVLAAANIPTRWRLNRRVFRRAFHPALRCSRLLRHADGRLPYYPWWVSIPGYVIESYRKAWVRRFDKQRPAEGPWCNWRRLQTSRAWQASLADAELVFKSKGIISGDAKLSAQGHEQQLNLMQLKEIIYPKGQTHE